MKKILILAALSLAAISCTKSDVLDSPVLDKAINFNTYLGNAPVTKAQVQTTSTMGEIGFNVKALVCVQSTTGEGESATTTLAPFASNPYMNVLLSKKGEATSWTYVEASDNNVSRNYYWPTNTNEKLVFVGYGVNVEGTYDETSEYIAFDEGSSTNFTYTVPRSIEDQQDLLAANTDLYDQNNGKDGVSLVFNHLLSRIHFEITSNGGNGTDGTLPVHINSLKLKGKFIESSNISLASIVENNVVGTITTPGNAAEEDFEYVVIDAKKTFATKEESQAIFKDAVGDVNKYMMIIPQSTTGVSIVGEYTIDEDPTIRPIEIPLAQLDKFEAGKAYKFVLNVKTSTIKFTVEVSEWDEVDADKKFEI